MRLTAVSILCLTLCFTVAAVAQTYDDATLAKVTALDASGRGADGAIPELPAAEHLYRADVYQSNRHFAEARGHWMRFLAAYPGAEGTSRALFGIGRGYMWEREYEKAITWFEKLTPDYADTKEGREGLAFRGASYIRLGKSLEGARVYEQYAVMYPKGEKIDSAHLNIIDAYREAGRFREANDWVARTRAKFTGTAVETNALHAKLRMEIGRANWEIAIETADALLSLNIFKGSMTGQNEVTYLKAFALEKSGRAEAIDVYASLPTGIDSYWGGLGADALARLDPERVIKSADVASRQPSEKFFADFPVLYREEVLAAARKHGLDPRFLLAVMKQESRFDTKAKSPAAARGLLQLVMDTAVKYAEPAGLGKLEADDLYDPKVNIALGAAYIGALVKEFGGMYEAVAASYNAGEDNAARWLARTSPKTPAVFTSEVGFSETKNYVIKVMGNYRAYCALYDENLSER